MIFVPFIYFASLLSYFIYKHKTVLDVCVYMAGLYTFTSLCAIIVVLMNRVDESGILFDEYNLKLGIVPTLLYCLTLTLSILPFSMIYNKDIKQITPTMPYVLDIVSIVLIGVALLNFYLIADSTLEILSGDLSNLRSDHYEGILSPAELKAEALPPILKLYYYFNISTILALPILFYNICFRKKFWIYNLLLFFTSLSCPLVGIQVADRTEFIFYALMLILCVILFHKFFTKKIKRMMAWATVPIASAFIVYLVAVSSARFDEKVEGGASASALQYAGQGYLNFCYFWENAKTEYIAAEREFPLIAHTFARVDSNPQRRSDRTGQQGFFISVFPTFVGDIMLDITPMGMIAWVVMYFLVVCMVIKSSHRETFSIGEVILIFVMGVIPVFGIFYYRYCTFQYSLMVMIAVALFFSSKYKIVLK